MKIGRRQTNRRDLQDVINPNQVFIARGIFFIIQEFQLFLLQNIKVKFNLIGANAFFLPYLKSCLLFDLRKYFLKQILVSIYINFPAFACTGNILSQYSSCGYSILSILLRPSLIWVLAFIYQYHISQTIVCKYTIPIVFSFRS